jgi:hypothetical protein
MMGAVPLGMARLRGGYVAESSEVPHACERTSLDMSSVHAEIVAPMNDLRRANQGCA